MVPIDLAHLGLVNLSPLKLMFNFKTRNDENTFILVPTSFDHPVNAEHLLITDTDRGKKEKEKR